MREGQLKNNCHKLMKLSLRYATMDWSITGLFFVEAVMLNILNDFGRLGNTSIYKEEVGKKSEKKGN